MSLVDVDRPVTFTVKPPRSTVDLSMYEYAQRNVAQLEPAQRHALAWALSMYHDPTPVERAAPAAPTLARRRVGLREAIRGVECCDPLVTAQWQLWRVCFYVVAAIFAVVLVAGLLFGRPGVVLAIGVACLASCALSFSMMRGEATVCR